MQRDWDEIRRKRRRAHYQSFMLGDYGSGGSGGTEWQDETSSLLARMSSAPDSTRIVHIDKLVRDLKTAGIWDKLDVLYILAAHDAQAARLNWKADLYNLTAVNSPTFTTDRGYAGDGSTSYLDTTWDPATNGVNFVRDSASMLVWSRTAAASAATTNYICGQRNAGAINRFIPRNSAGNMTYRLNQASDVSAASSDGSGLWCISRSGASATQAYRNGSAFGSAGSVASVATDTNDMSIGAASGGFSVGQAAAFGLGGNLNGTEQTALYTALNTYLTAVGAA